MCIRDRNILVPALYSATDEVLNALNEFVANGGNMVVTFKSAFSDEQDVYKRQG